MCCRTLAESIHSSDAAWRPRPRPAARAATAAAAAAELARAKRRPPARARAARDGAAQHRGGRGHERGRVRAAGSIRTVSSASLGSGCSCCRLASSDATPRRRGVQSSASQSAQAPPSMPAATAPSASSASGGRHRGGPMQGDIDPPRWRARWPMGARYISSTSPCRAKTEGRGGSACTESAAWCEPHAAHARSRAARARPDSTPVVNHTRQPAPAPRRLERRLARPRSTCRSTCRSTRGEGSRPHHRDVAWVSVAREVVVV